MLVVREEVVAWAWSISSDSTGSRLGKVTLSPLRHDHTNDLARSAMSTSAETADAGIANRTVQADERSDSLQPGIDAIDSRTRTPPPPATAGNEDSDKAKGEIPRPQSSTSVKLHEGAPTSISPYSSLQYAPRQKPALAHRPSQSNFQSHSSLGKQQQQAASSSNLAEPSILSSFPHSAASASSPVVSTMAIEGLSASDEQVQKNADQISAAETLAKQQLRADAEELGVRVGSLGWAILEQIYFAPNAEWTELGELLNRGEAVLLLPTSPLRSSEVTLSQAYNHIIFSTLQSTPPLLFTSSVKGKEKEFGGATLVTFKGLRANLIDDTDPARSILRFTSFIPREDMKFVSQMRTVLKRTELFKTLSPLPGTSTQALSSPHFHIFAHASSLLLPPALSRREPQKNRSRSSSNGTLLSVEQRQTNRASASFATLFGGRRERKTSGVAPGENGTELKEVGGPTMNAIQVVQPTRIITVAIIESEIRRSQVLKDIAANTKASIRLRLTQGTLALPRELIDVVCSFADMFVPAFAASAPPTSAALSASTDTDYSRLGSGVPLPAPFLYAPDQLADTFQDFYNSIKAHLQEAGEDFDIQNALHQVEAVVCSEVYDRIFCPYASMDLYHDEALTSRIDNLDQMGINLQRLGLLLTEDGSEESILIKGGLDDIVERCGVQLQLLEDQERLSPSDKLEVLVSAHKIIVEGLARLPRLDLVDEVDAKKEEREREDIPGDKEADEEKKSTSSTSSADLILPILIYCIVKSNPSRLASNLLYIQRFHAEALARGEADYCLVNVQAAVAFLENVEAASLGLTSEIPLVTAAELEQQRRKENVSGQSATQVSQSLPMPTRMRSRVAHDVGELAGMSNRVITGVLGSSLGAFGRMMGAGTTYAMGIDSATATTPKTNGEMHKKQKSVEDIRGFLSGGAAAKLGSVLNKVVAMENEGKEGREPLHVKRSMPTKPQTSSVSRTATDYGAESVDRHKVALNNNSSSLLPTSKASVTDRLASLPHLSRTATGSPARSTSQLDPLPSATIARDPSRLPASGSGPVRLDSYKSSLEPLQRDSDVLRSPISAVSLTEPNMLLSPLDPTPSMRGSASHTQAHVPASLQSPFAPLSSPPTRERPLHIVLASTGSVASIKVPLMIESLLSHANVRIQVISTKASSHFYDQQSVLATAKEAESGSYTVSDLAKEIEKAGKGDCSEHDYPRLHFWSDEDEWQQWNRIGDSILHIELRRWADVVLIAPCSANTLAKINAGLCDDLLTSFLRALSPSTPTYLFPAMNTLMFMHPLTASHLAFAREQLGYHIIGPIEKRLACGDLGQGAMQEWSDIVDLVVNKYALVPAVQDESREEAV